MIKTLALNMVVHNEAHRLEETLKRASFLVDEMVIVDQESTDDTADIAHGFGAKVLTDTCTGFAESSRQLALDNTDSTWVLSLDADEYCAEQFAEELRWMDQYRQVMVRQGCRIAGEYHKVGPPLFRIFQAKEFFYLPKMHTYAQPWSVVTPSMGRYTLPYVAIWDEKSWAELLEGFEAYERLGSPGIEWLHLARRLGVTGAELDAMTVEERHALGFNPEDG